MNINSDLNELTPEEIIEEAKQATLELLPKKSREKYEREYNLFKNWCTEKKIPNITENVILAYISIHSKTLKSSTLWSKFSMLKATLAAKDNIDIKYPKVIAFLKRQNSGYRAKKANTFSRSEMNTFISQAPDLVYLLMKVCLIIGVAGACRCDELIKLSIDDIDDKQSLLIITIPDSKTRMKRIFTVMNTVIDGVNILDIYRKYADLRSRLTEHRRFFVNYTKGKCTVQVVGKNTIAKLPSSIATFLELPNVKNYTGHSFRRTSATLLVDAGGDILSLKRHGGWRSTTVAEGYIEDSIENKKLVAQYIMGQDDIAPCSSKAINLNQILDEESERLKENEKPVSSECSTKKPITVSVNNSSNCTINIHF